MRISFDRFELDSGQRLLLADGEPVHLPPKAFALLETLVSGAPRALSKESLCNTIWPDTVVEESNLAGLVADLRDALGDDPRKPRFIRTVHGFGYSFCSEVSGGASRKRAATIVFRGDPLPLYRGENVLGRDPAADVEVDDSTVSRRHARLFIDDHSVTIEDLGSKNGTFIDGERLTAPRVLRGTEEVTVGRTPVILRKRGSVKSTATAAHRPLKGAGRSN